MLDESEVRGTDGIVGGTDRDAVQLPATGAAIAQDPAIADVVLVSRNQADDVAKDVLVGARGVEDVVAVQILGIQRPITVGAATAQVAPGKDRHRCAQLALAEWQVADHSSSRRVNQDIGAIAQNPGVGYLSVEDVDAAPLGVESPHADVLTPTVRGVAPIGGDAVGGNAERVLIDRAQIEYQPHPCRLGGARCRVLKDPELEIFVAGKIQSGGTEWGDHRAPTGPAEPFRLGPARGVVLLDNATSRVRMQSEIQRSLQLLCLSGNPDQGVDILRPQ